MRCVCARGGFEGPQGRRPLRAAMSASWGEASEAPVAAGPIGVTDTVPHVLSPIFMRIFILIPFYRILGKNGKFDRYSMRKVGKHC